jgi:hypothetical protein
MTHKDKLFAQLELEHDETKKEQLINEYFKEEGRKLKILGEKLSDLLENSDVDGFQIMSSYDVSNLNKMNPSLDVPKVKEKCFIDIFRRTYYLCIYSWDIKNDFISLL